MEEKMKRLPDAELDIMLVVWSAAHPVSSSYIQKHLEGRRKWTLPTLMTVLSRLCEKGFLVCEKQGRNNLYYAKIAEDDYKEAEGKSILEKLYGNSFMNMVTSLYNGNMIDSGDLSDLREFLERLKKEE